MATKRLIDANDALERLEKAEQEMVVVSMVGCKAVSMYGVIKFIKTRPTVDAVEVVHGRWVYDSGSGKYFCSACDENALSFKKDTIYGGELYEVCLTDYCPNCGAKMDGDGNG